MHSVILTGAVLAALVAALPAQAQNRSRLAPPAVLSCERNALTSFEGSVEALRPGESSWTLVLRTDWDSLETFAFDPSGQQIQHAELLPEPGLPAYVDCGGHFPPGLSVIVWVCSSPASVTVDWRPDQD